jgi:hypothetical protein
MRRPPHHRETTSSGSSPSRSSIGSSRSASTDVRTRRRSWEVWLDGPFAFCTGCEEQKMRNLQANP